MTGLIETEMYYKSKHSDVYSTMVDLSKADDRVNNSLLGEKIREADLSGCIIALIGGPLSSRPPGYAPV